MYERTMIRPFRSNGALYMRTGNVAILNVPFFYTCTFKVRTQCWVLPYCHNVCEWTVNQFSGVQNRTSSAWKIHAL